VIRDWGLKMASSMLEPGIFLHPRPKKSLLPPPSKKRKTEHKIEEISFDDEKRADYLTGFHKRKVARAKMAQVEAAKKAREERVQMRKQVCSSAVLGGIGAVLMR
jgi:ribosomal RNA-processing protein 17